MHSPAMGNQRSKLIQTPTKRIHCKKPLRDSQRMILPLNHDGKIQDQQNRKLNRLENRARPGHNEPVLVQQRRVPRIVQRDRLQLVVVRDNVPLRRGRVDDAALINSRHDPLARRRAQEVLALRQDGHLEGREGAVIAAPDAPLGLLADVTRGLLVRVEAGDEDVGKEKEAFAAVVILAEAAQDACGDNLAEGGARPVDVLAVAGVGFFVEKLGAVDQ